MCARSKDSDGGYCFSGKTQSEYVCDTIKNTKPEVYLRKLLFAQGYRYRIADKSVPGHPDIFLRKYNTAIFVNGCFWHRHPGCKYAYTPKSRVEFWQKKFDDNVRRDSAVKAELLEHGIKCLIVWECTIKRMVKSSDVENRSFSNAQVFFARKQSGWNCDIMDLHIVHTL